MLTAYELWKDFRFSDSMRICSCGGSLSRKTVIVDDPRDTGCGMGRTEYRVICSRPNCPVFCERN